MSVVILPTTLFQNNELLKQYKKVYIIEHPVNFTDYNYHKLKLVLHRASMKFYADYIREKYNSKVIYLGFDSDLDKIFKKENHIVLHDPVDHAITNNLKLLARKHKIDLEIIESPCFISKLKDLKEFTEGKDNFFHHVFYKWFRQKYDILMKNDNPIGGKWSFDTENRKPFPQNYKESYKVKTNNSVYVKEAINYIKKNFPDNPGTTNFYLPIDFKGAKKHLNGFFKMRFKTFGPYEDAVNKDIFLGSHSLLSPLMNIGLLTPEFVMTEAIKFGTKHKVPMQSLEGFVRQLTWREYCRLLYVFKRKELEDGNYFNHHTRLTKNWYDNSKKKIGIALIDDLIEKVLNYGYLHHIERLMYIGNFMLISRILPKDVFKWFQCMFLDSYHVFMYPNVYGMSQHSAGPIMMKRPYFSSSNYISKMSNYKKNKGKDDWFEVWDELYYKFLKNHKNKFKHNYALAAQIKNL